MCMMIIDAPMLHKLKNNNKTGLKTINNTTYVNSNLESKASYLIFFNNYSKNSSTKRTFPPTFVF